MPPYINFALNDSKLIFVFVLFALGSTLYTWFRTGNTSFSSGYVLLDEATGSCLRKAYGDVTVSFYAWGGMEGSPLIDESCLSADGVFAIISAPGDLTLKNSGSLFDEMDVDTEKGCVITAKKKGIFLSGEKMHHFLDDFDLLFRKDLIDRA